MAKQGPNIFISYRREDTKHVTGRLYDRLRQEFGAEAIFKDVDSIPFGANFREVLAASVNKCDAMVVVIGHAWNPADDTGRPRMLNPRDFVRIEVEAALARKIMIVPVLVEDTPMPLEGELPESMHSLPDYNAMKLRADPDFHADVDRLIRDIKMGWAARKAEEEAEARRKKAEAAEAAKRNADEATKAEGRRAGEAKNVKPPRPRASGSSAEDETSRPGVTAKTFWIGWTALLVVFVCVAAASLADEPPNSRGGLGLLLLSFYGPPMAGVALSWWVSARSRRDAFVRGSAAGLAGSSLIWLSWLLRSAGGSSSSSGATAFEALLVSVVFALVTGLARSTFLWPTPRDRKVVESGSAEE